MNTLSYTQEYFLCAINNRGIAPYSFDSTFSACLVVGGVRELLDQGYIVRVSNGDFTICKEWDDSIPYLKPLYETIMSSRRADDAKGIAGVYMSILSRKRFEEFYSAIGASLVELGYADETDKHGISKNTTKYVPKAESVKYIMEKIYTDFIEEGTLPEETVCLSALLDKSMLIRNYYGKVSIETMRNRIEEVRRSEACDFVNAALNAYGARTVLAI